jgi:hypothetical protein
MTVSIRIAANLSQLLPIAHGSSVKSAAFLVETVTVDVVPPLMSLLLSVGLQHGKLLIVLFRAVESFPLIFHKPPPLSIDILLLY